MARGHSGLPKPSALTIVKSEILTSLKSLDENSESIKRVLRMETEFRKRIGTHVGSLPLQDALFSKFNTNPFVLLFHAVKKAHHHISQIEQDILPAKLFSSMETSAGRMVEQVVLPVYGWEYVPSVMHSAESVLDGRRVDGEILRCATLKSGPRCLNDEMSENIADAILANATGWATAAGVKEVEFTYGVLYGTKRLSNKKDWHILRKLEEKLPADAMLVRPENRWDNAFALGGIKVTVTIRIGIELWDHFAGGGSAFLELACALIRACIAPTDTEPEDYPFTIRDLASIISLDIIPPGYNVSILQRSQWEWLFFFVRHFCDSLESR